MDKSRHDQAGGRGVGVGGRLRQRLAQILLHSSCATTSTTAFVGVASTNAAAATVVTNNAAASRQEPPPPRCAHEPQPKLVNGRCQRRHRRRSSRALVHISIDCSARSVGAAVLPSPVPAARGAGAVKSGTRRKGDGSRRISSPLYSWSSSSDTDGELAPFSSDGERGQATDTRSTLFSSHSFSSDTTADFYSATGPSTRPRRHRNPPPRRAAPPPRRAPRPPDVFRPPASAAGKVKHDKEKNKKLADRKNGGDAVAAAGSTAVVKRSHDPYADFRSSMVEMVAGRRLRGADALSELLVWYLSLNSPRHHPAILAAFEDVWEAVLGSEP
ncbi:hypothetical protein SEVIR_3G132300v4 [Setaria viridis]|uniref:Transcription repressor n=2 Tax=Setaria viridis TaxID=4556 RepID=A0A4U6VCR0_SETVI|nr:uncharacterized protein LOC117847779 [Setaria viridis]TKW25643.1 hypothetical protein SEVIR_3G132300v2 [Setaria viridis]